MLFFAPNTPLILALEKIPTDTTLVEFVQALGDIFQKLHDPDKDEPDTIEELGKLMGFRYSGKKVRSDNTMRVLRHMIYHHTKSIKDYISENQTGTKELQLNHCARLRILLAKRLSKYRIPVDQREEILSNADIKGLAEMLVTPGDALKKQLAQLVTGASPESISKREMRDSLEKRGPTYIRLPLNRRAGMALEIEQRLLHHWRGDEEAQHETIEKFLELLYDIDPNSPTAAKIHELIQKEISSKKTAARSK